MTSSSLVARLSGASLGMVFPDVCGVCGCRLVEGERVICLGCLAAMPRTNLHRSSFSSIHRRLAAPGVPVERAAAWFAYSHDSPWSHLIRKGKYDDAPYICRWLGESFAREIAPEGFFDGIDLILPVGMHFLKRLRRGYNQACEIARGINAVTGIPVGTHIRACRPRATQTRRSAVERAANASGIFRALPEAPVGRCVSLTPVSLLWGRLTGRSAVMRLDGLHVLIVDDVITTGSTVLACCKAVLGAAPGVRISVLSIGLTGLT